MNNCFNNNNGEACDTLSCMIKADIFKTNEAKMYYGCLFDACGCSGRANEISKSEL